MSSGGLMGQGDQDFEFLIRPTALKLIAYYLLQVGMVSNSLTLCSTNCWFIYFY